MTGQRKPLCFIPARGGSKRLVRKNMALLQGKPLLALTIECARVSGLFDRIYVSSENREILNSARAWGAAPLPREAELAGDQVTLLELCLETMKGLSEETGATDLYLMLPSSPFRKPSSVRQAWELFLETGADSLVSVVPFDHPPQWALTERDKLLAPLYPDDFDRPRQNLAPAFRHDGSHLIVRIASLLKHRKLLGPATVPFFITREEGLDVNEPLDLLWAEFLLEKGKVN